MMCTGGRGCRGSAHRMLVRCLAKVICCRGQGSGFRSEDSNHRGGGAGQGGRAGHPSRGRE